MPTLRELRRAASDRVAPCEVAVSGAVGSDGAYYGTSPAGDRRHVASSDLGSLDAAGLGPEAPPDGLRNDWLYVPSAPATPGPYRPPQQRRIPENGYNAAATADEALDGFDPLVVDPTQPVGLITLERPFLGVVPAGVELELHAIPPLRGGRSAGYHAAVNRACRVILREDTVQVPVLPGTTSVDVTASFPWLNTPGLLVSAHPVETSPGIETYAIPGARLRFDADRLLLWPNPGGSAGQSMPVRALRPIGTWIKPAGGAWGESTIGLQDDDDEVLGDADAIATVAAFYVATEQAQASIVGSSEQTWWQARARLLAASTPFLRDQRVRKPPTGYGPWPDLYSPYNPVTGGRMPPYFR